MKPTPTCTCGACKTCRQRACQARLRAERKARRDAFVITVDQAEAMTFAQWMRLPEQVIQRIVNDYVKG
jgi:hypothetical protein